MAYSISWYIFEYIQSSFISTIHGFITLLFCFIAYFFNLLNLFIALPNSGVLIFMPVNHAGIPNALHFLFISSSTSNFSLFFKYHPIVSDILTFKPFIASTFSFNDEYDIGFISGNSING